MPDSRREFLAKTAGIGLAATFLPLIQPAGHRAVHAAAEKLDGQSPLRSATDERFWTQVRNAFNLSPQFINLEAGYYSPQPDAGVDEVSTQAQQINELFSFYMRRQWLDDVASVNKLLARFTGCSDEEVLITRNTTESLNIVIMGLDLKAGDEAIFGRYE